MTAGDIVNCCIVGGHRPPLQLEAPVDRFDEHVGGPGAARRTVARIIVARGPRGLHLCQRHTLFDHSPNPIANDGDDSMNAAALAEVDHRITCPCGIYHFRDERGLKPATTLGNDERGLKPATTFGNNVRAPTVVAGFSPRSSPGYKCSIMEKKL